MPPQQPYPTPPPNYDFIMNPGKPPRKKIPLAGKSLAGRVLLVVGILFALIIIFSIIARVLSGGGNNVSKADLISIAQDQTQILHLSDSGTANSVADVNKNFAYTTQLAVSSQQTAYLAYLKSNGIKPSTKQLGLKQDAAVDSALTTAQTASSFDSTYATVLKSALTTYQKDLAAAYPKAGPKLKPILQSDYAGVNLLLKQIPSNESS